MFAYMLVLRVVLSLMSRCPRSAVGIYQFNYYSVMMFKHMKEHRGGMILKYPNRITGRMKREKSPVLLSTL